jgi:conjugative relaxase-like TrwC/TraI family protein
LNNQLSFSVCPLTFSASPNYYSTSETHSEFRYLTQAVWHGKGAFQLGLEGNVLKEDFKDLFYGFKPGTRERIRGSKPNPETQERLAEDLTFSAPKSVSMALHLGGDWRLFEAHTHSVKEVLTEIEKRYITTRIQKNGERQVVNTNNSIVALIPHHTSRDGDLQLHTHAVIMNGVQGADGIWRALHNDAMSQQKWLGSLYRQKLAHKVQQLGYEIYETKDGFELKGITRENIEVFSKRLRSIIRIIERDGLDLTPAHRDQAALSTRQTKHITQTLEEFQQQWKAEADKGKIEVPRAGKAPVQFLGSNTVEEELNSAIAHLEERSVAGSREDIYQYVFNHLQSFEVSELDQAIDSHQKLISVEGKRFIL